MKRPVEDGLSLLAGAGVGMALMYLLDPAMGSHRRNQIQKATRQRLAQAGDAASAGLDHLHDAVDRAAHAPAVQMMATHAADAAKGIYNHLGGHAAAMASDYQRQANDAADHLRSSFSSKIDDLRDQANHLSDTASARYRRWLNRASLAAGRDEDHHYVGQTTCALASLALGAGLVYLLDPNEGGARRSKLVGRTNYAVHEVGDFFRKTGRRLVTRGRVVARSASDRTRDAVSHFHTRATESDRESVEASMGT